MAGSSSRTGYHRPRSRASTRAGRTGGRGPPAALHAALALALAAAAPLQIAASDVGLDLVAALVDVDRHVAAHQLLHLHGHLARRLAVDDVREGILRLRIELRARA